MSNFIGEQYLRDLTPISNNLDIELIKPQIDYYEDSYIRQILGDALFFDLKSKFQSQTLSPDEQSLVLLLKPAIAYGSAELSVPFINTQIRNKGTMNLDAENAAQAEIERMRLLRQELRDRANFYMERVRMYLSTNSSLFTLYIFTNDDMNPDTKSNYESDIYIEPCGSCNKVCCGCNGWW